jgi:putative endonuclease
VIRPSVQAEKLVCDWLEERGWRIIERNYRTRRSEVDILASKDGILAAVEVKLASDGSATMALEKIDPAKQARISHAVLNYLGGHECPEEVRFDVALVRGTPPDLRVDLYLEDAFRPD